MQEVVSKNNINTIHSSDTALTSAYKRSNFYKLKKKQYSQMLNDSITTAYKKTAKLKDILWLLYLFLMWFLLCLYKYSRRSFFTACDGGFLYSIFSLTVSV